MEYKEVAEWLLFGSSNSTFEFTELLNKLHLEFRKNKGIVDINKALERIKNPKIGYNKIELESAALEIYLKDILKRQRKVKS